MFALHQMTNAELESFVLNLWGKSFGESEVTLFGASSTENKAAVGRRLCKRQSTSKQT